MLCAGFGEGQDTGVEGKSRQDALVGGFRRAAAPVEASRDHQVQGQPEVALHADGDALADPAHLLDPAPLDGGDRRRGGAQQKRPADRDALEASAQDAVGEGLYINGDVRQFGHATILPLTNAPRLTSKQRGRRVHMKSGWMACGWLAAATAFGFQAAPPPAAAPAPPPPATSSVEGQVFNLSTGAPLKRANVRLAGIGRRQSGGMPSILAKETDEQGRFAFSNLEAGRYQLTVERQGFLRQSYGGRKYN